MIAVLLQDQLGALAGRQDVVAQIDEVDAVPQRQRRLHRLEIGLFGIAAEIALRIAEGGFAQAHEAFKIPLLQHVLLGVDEHREVEIVGDIGNGLAVARRPAGLQHGEAFDDQDVGPVDGDAAAGHDVIDEVRVDRRLDVPLAGLDVGEEVQQRLGVVALRKTLLLHQVFAFERGVREQEAVGGDEIDLRRVRPARQQRLQHARGGRLADRDRAGDADDEGDLDVGRAEEGLAGACELLLGRDVEGQEARDRQVDRLDLVDRQLVGEGFQPRHLFGRQRHRRIGTLGCPFGAGEHPIGRRRVGVLDHSGSGQLVGQ